MRAWAGATALAALAVLTGPTPTAAASCREPAPGSPDVTVRWVHTGTSHERSALQAWCDAVGTPVLVRASSQAAQERAIERFAVVVWNVHVGGGAVRRLLAELRSGALTDGRAVDHFVLLLQEVARAGDAVPATLTPAADWARPIRAPVDRAHSIDALAAEAGLHGFYAPSMRNGGLREDRGNAILSTFPLLDPEAIELPYERQRRVAVSARIALSHDHGAASLRLVSTHFDNTSSLLRFWRSFGTGRARQARALADALDAEEAVVLGGDFNTWYDQGREPAVLVLRSRFPLPRELPAAPTFAPPFGLPERQVDYLLSRLPGGWRARYRVATERLGSDHAPLIGWVERDGGG